uniref:Kinesin motor domain-containing protein n=1 Tax=Physcomitrium patens TaxID=3218 RepID=A0A7I4DPL9_PHYPA|nr:kinesin-like protein KIN-12F isoform X2 [Physcomitrium patens]|eukprot:XP_024376844.1 kinesin-like protein KIN-12F isoform X2 [Physcomitrella patens]
MYQPRMFSDLPSPKKLAYEESEADDLSLRGEDEAESTRASTPQLAFVTTRRDTGGGGDLSPLKSVSGTDGGHFSSFNLSPPRTIRGGKKRHPALAMAAGNPVPSSPRSEQPNAGTPVRAAKRKTKLTLQSRPSPDNQREFQCRTSPSLTRDQFDTSRVSASAIKSLQQSASFSGISGSVKLGQLSHKGGGDSMPSTPQGSRKTRNFELYSSTTSLGSVTSAATPRSASRSLRFGGRSSSSKGLAGLSSTRASGAAGNRVKALFQNQQAATIAAETHFELEEDPTFWQDHNVQVLIRTRPINDSEASQQGHSRCVRQESAHSITWLGQPESRFTFDHVAGESISQEELFRVAGLPMVENCMAGYNSCMFAYGQTGSGKTHTMLGDISDLDSQPSDNRGMTPRVFESLFAKIREAEELQKHENLKFTCRCSFLEIYNEQIGDLLEPSSTNLQMREDANKGVYVEGLVEVEVQSVQDVLHLLLLGAANRRVAATNMNKESSRSHSVFSCIIESQWESDHMINFRFGRLNLIDLAGSERQRASGAEGERLKEAACINKSLSTLGLVIMVLVDTANGKQRHVPYRDSKLTFLLQDSLGGNSKTTIIANISPSSCASLETLSSLKFAQRAKFIQNNAVINEDTAGDVNALRQQIQQLKDELARLRRQSISRIPTIRASGGLREEAIYEGSPPKSEELNSSMEGSVAHFGRALQSPTFLNIKVKQRTGGTCCNKTILRLHEENLQRLETSSDGDATTEVSFGEEAISSLKELSLTWDGRGCDPEVTKLAMENMRLQEQLRKLQHFHTNGEREAMAQEISDLRDQLVDLLGIKLSLDSPAHSQEIDSAVRVAADRRQGSQMKTLEVNHLELKNAQHQRHLFALKTQLIKSEEKAEEELKKRTELEHQLRELLQETISLKASLEDERVPGRGLEKQIEDYRAQECRTLNRAESSEAHDPIGNRRVRHHDAILQLQMELDTLDGDPESTNRSYMWEEGTRDKNEKDVAGVHHSVTILQLRSDLESAEITLEKQQQLLKEVEASRECLQKQLDDTISQLYTEKEAVIFLESCRTRAEIEIDSLRDDHKVLLEKMREMEEKESKMKQELTQLKWEIRKEQELRSIERDLKQQNKHGARVDLPIIALDAEFENATLELERSKNLSTSSRCEKSCRAERTLEQQMDTRPRAELKDALGTTSIHLELSELRNEVAGAMERETATRDNVARLSEMFREKDAETCELQQDWEDAAAKLIDYLASGKLSVDVACLKSSQDLFNIPLSVGKNAVTDRIVSKVLTKKTAIMDITKQLQHTQNLTNSFGHKLQDALSKFSNDYSAMCCKSDLDEDAKVSILQVHKDSISLKAEVDSCDIYLREIERQSTIAFILVWWLSETASLRCVAEDRMRVELTEAVAKIQEIQGVVFSLQLEREKTPEQESRAIQLEALRVHRELAAWEEERIRLAAKNRRFETQVGRTAKILEDLNIQLWSADQRLQQVTQISLDIDKAQSSLVIVKENWNLKNSALAMAAREAEQRPTRIEEELSAAKGELKKLQARTRAAEARGNEVQNEKAQLEKELKHYLDAVQVLPDDLQNQIELKEHENIRLKEQMAEQYEDWVLERLDLLAATREAESRCIEKNQIIRSLQNTLAKLEEQVSGGGYKQHLRKGSKYKPPEDELVSRLEYRVEELKEGIDRLTAENMEMKNEKRLLSNDPDEKINIVAQKEKESSAMQKRLMETEVDRRQVEAKVATLTLLIKDLTCSNESLLSENKFLKVEVERLRSCWESVKMELESYQKECDSGLRRLIETEENKEFLESHPRNMPAEGLKNVPAELKETHESLASSEEQVNLLTEKVKLLNEIVSTMGKDWETERQNLIAEKEDLRMELYRLEQHAGIRRGSDQPLRNLDENRSVSVPDARFNTKQKDKQEAENTRTENVKLRSRICEQDQAYLCVRMELSAVRAERKNLEIEIDKIVAEKQHFLRNEEDVRKRLEATSLEVTQLHAHTRSCEAELQRLTTLLVESEEQMNAAQKAWREEKAELESQREEAQVEANEKKNQAAAMLVKLEEWKTTLRDADSMVTSLVSANKKAKERWRREKELLALAHTEEFKKMVQEMLEVVALTKEQVDMTMGLAEGELHALVAEAHILKLDMTHEMLKLKREISENIYDNSGSNELPPSARCLDSERRSWEHQIKAASVVLAQKESTIRILQTEVEKSRRQAESGQTLHTETQALLQEKEKIVLKLVNELSYVKQSMNRDRNLRQSLTRDVDGVTSLRRSFSCKISEQKDDTVRILKEEQGQLKTMIFNLEVENAELQQQILEAGMKTKALESAIELFQKSGDRWMEEVQSLHEHLDERDRHICELESHNVQLRDEMQRQAASFAELYELLKKQEGALESEARTIANHIAAEKEVLLTLQEEKAELKSLVERLDADLTIYEKKASCAGRSQAEVERLQVEMEVLRKEVTRIESIQKELEVQNATVDEILVQRANLESALASKNNELTMLGEELKSTRNSADMAAHKSEELEGHVQDLLGKASVLNEELRRKRAAIEALEAALLTVEDTMARCLEEASVDLKELETERDYLLSEIRALTEQVELKQILADEQTAIAVEARQDAEFSRTRAEEKEIEAEILGKSVMELESTVYALESQLGLVTRECEQQRLMREDMEMELQRLHNSMSVRQAALEEANARIADEILEAQFAREEAERKLEEKDAEMQQAQKKLQALQKDSEIKAEKLKHSKAQITYILAEAEKKAAEYEGKVKLKTIETVPEEQANSQSKILRGPRLKGTGSTFACIGMGHQVNFELNVERQIYEHRIQELETELINQQNEVCILNEKLGAAERMTRELFGNLLEVKSDMTNVVRVLGEQQEQNALHIQEASLEKEDKEAEQLNEKLNEVIEERESWLEEISRKQSELVAAQDAVNRLRERERVLCAENENLKVELRTQQKIAGGLKQEVEKLSGQQNLQQRIKHHVKIKDENNLLRIQNDELSGKLRRAEVLHARVSEELTKYRLSEGKTPLINFDEEQRLRTEVQELEEQKSNVSQKLEDVCAHILEVAGIADSSTGREPVMALEVLSRLKSRLESSQKELEDSRLKVKIVEEKHRLNELRIAQSPMKRVDCYVASNLAPR